MKQPDQAAPESTASAAAGDAAHAHTWLDTFAESFVVEIADDMPGNTDHRNSGKSKHCTHTVPLDTWWTRLI